MIKNLSLAYRMTGFITIMCVLFVVADVWRSVASRAAQISEMTTASSNLARAMAEHANDSFKAADIIVAGIVERVENDGTGPAAVDRLHRLLVSRVADLSDPKELGNIDIFDKNGRCLTDGLVVPNLNHNNSDREDFTFHRTHDDRGPHIGAPVISKVTGTWVIPLSRRINAADGSFAGVVLASIDLDFFSRFYSGLDVGQDGAIGLIRDDGTMIVRRPYDTRFIGKSVRDSDLFRAHILHGTSGTFFTKSSQDGVTRLNSFRSLRNYPLFVAAALSKDEILAGWWSDTLWHSSGVCALVFALAMFGRRLVRQVSVQTRTERALAASLETTHAILNTATNPIVTVSRYGKVLSFNPAGERAFGYASDEIVGRNIRTLVPESSFDAYDNYASSLNNGELSLAGSGFELAGRRKDGTDFPAYVSTGSMVLDGEICFVCVVTDVTSQQKQRADLAAARDQLLLAADTAQLGIWYWNLSDDAVRWNDRMFDIYELPRSLSKQGLYFDRWRACLHPDDVLKTIDEFNELISGSNVEISSYRIVLPNGTIRHIQTRAKLERDASGHAVAITGVSHDVTVQQELELHLRTAKVQADTASAAKSLFLANMSHEIRTPMNAVLGMLHLVQLTELNARQLDYVGKAENAAKSLLRLLNDILDYSKIEAGKLQLESAMFDLEPIMQGLGIILAGNQGQKEVEVLFDLDSNLPKRFIGDSLRLQQILINLAGNALKFTLRGQVVVSVEKLSNNDRSVLIRVAVTDSGIGIGDDQLQRIFEGFNQAEASTSRRFGGSGLGLVICKRLISLMGGELRVESKVGVGSRFWFDIALEAVHEVTSTNRLKSFDHPVRLLIADDNPVAAEILVRTAESFGWHADYVRGGVDAVAKVAQVERKEDRYDVVLMDWRMADLDGLNAAKLIRGGRGVLAPPEVIMITAYGREEILNTQEGGIRPFVDFLIKPVTPTQLAEAVAKALRPSDAAHNVLPVMQRSARLKGMRILVVEDNALNRQVADGLLKAEGADVRLAEGGLDGVNQVLSAMRPFDVVLMDLQMPDIDGFEATRRIRDHARFAMLPIIAMTANASDTDRKACLEADMNDHIGKPINVDSLVSVLLKHTADDRIKSAESSHDFNPPGDGLIEARESIVARFGGNIGLIQRVLESFPEETGRLLLRLSEQVATANFTGAAASCHAIKGNAGNVGARELSLRAGKLERDLNQGDLAARQNLLTAACVDELQTLLRDSADQLDHAFQHDSIEGVVEVFDPLTPVEWGARLHEIALLLDASNLQAIAAAEALSARTPAERREIFDLFLQHVRALDFKKAAGEALAMLGS